MKLKEDTGGYLLQKSRDYQQCYAEACRLGKESIAKSVAEMYTNTRMELREELLARNKKLCSLAETLDEQGRTAELIEALALPWIGKAEALLEEFGLDEEEPK